MKDWKVVNLTSKNIKDFTNKDTLYVRKRTPSGHVYFYLCKFIEYKRGIVTAKVFKIEHDYLKRDLGTILTARITNCYLWGSTQGDKWDRAHWFTKEGVAE